MANWALARLKGDGRGRGKYPPGPFFSAVGLRLPWPPAIILWRERRLYNKNMHLNYFLGI